MGGLETPDQFEKIGLLLEPAKTVLVGVPGPVEFECKEFILHPQTPMDSLTFSKSLQNDCVQFAAERGINVDELFTHELDWNRRWEPNGCSIRRRSGRAPSSSFCGYAFDFAAIAA